MSDNAVKVWCTVKDGCHPKKRDVLVRAFTRNGLGEWEDTTRHPKRKHAAAWDPKDFANQAGVTEAAAELPIITQWPKQPVLVTGEEGTTRKVAVLACPRCAPGKQKVSTSRGALLYSFYFITPVGKIMAAGWVLKSAKDK